MSRPSALIACSSALLLTAAMGTSAAQSGEVLHTFDGKTPFEAFGGALAGCGDLDGDGLRDLLVGCQKYGVATGDAWAFSSATGYAIHRWTAPFHADGIGDAGDVNGDGVTDVIVGDSFASPNFSGEGSVWIYSGATGEQIHKFLGGGPSRYLGEDVDGLGDINGDGRSDVIMGAWGETGKSSFSGVVYVRSGLDGSILHRIEGSVDHGYFGNSVTRVDDTDGDGITDFAVGAFGEGPVGTNTGAVYLYSGASGALLRSWTGPTPFSSFGAEVRDVGDADGDGFGDIVVAARGNQPNGRVFLYSGATGAQLATWGGYHPDEVFGVSVDGAGDLDGDGLGDVIVGSDKYYDPAGWTGFVYAFSGATGERLQYFTGGSPTARLGIAVAGVGDVTGDGIPDLAAGAINQTTPAGGTHSGRVFLFSGERTGLLHDVSPFDGGVASTFRLVGGQPGSTAIFAVSLAGNGPLPTAYGPIFLSVPIVVLNLVPFTGSDVASFTLNIPAVATGALVHSQAVEVHAAGGGAASHGLTLVVH